MTILEVYMVAEIEKETLIAEDVDIIINILRIITLLEKALERQVRQCFFSPAQYPQQYHDIMGALNTLRMWLKIYRPFCHTAGFHGLMAISLNTVGQMVIDFIALCRPKKGKKQVKRTLVQKQRQSLAASIYNMLDHIQACMEQLNTGQTDISIELETALVKAFADHCQQEHAKWEKMGVSKRGDKTIIFPCSDSSLYLVLVNDKKQFRCQMLANINSWGNVCSHRPGCKATSGYSLNGFRTNPRKTVTQGGQKQVFPIRICCCKECGQRFSLLPSFLPREKHFGIDIIGNVLRGILLSAHSLNSALESFKLTGRKLKSKQTLLNWIAWIGSHHPAAVLSRAGVNSAGYFQEDEGFEKEPDMRTYTVAMVDSATLLVWHLDYVDHVDADTLCASFSKFVNHIDFKILGVTKDKWQASTQALKAVFYRVWIGFCHRHLLKKVRCALSEYQNQTQCTNKEVKSAYDEFKNILATATSKVNLEVKLSQSKQPAFVHPSLSTVIKEVKKNAVHYAANKQRRGIKPTTSLVDNFLKTVKRKLRQVESFRDRNYTALLFQAMANVRNFMPFFSGAKNAHKSPFMLAGGHTFDLPWIQVMNMHNAFLFTNPLSKAVCHNL